MPTQTLPLADKQAETGLATTAAALKWATHQLAAPVPLLTREEVRHFASSLDGSVYTRPHGVITKL